MQGRDHDNMDRAADHFERPDGLSTVTEWLKWGARLDPDAPAVQDHDECLTHRQFDELTDRRGGGSPPSGRAPG